MEGVVGEGVGLKINGIWRKDEGSESLMEVGLEGDE